MNTDRRGTVPRLHQARMEVVEALDVGVEVLARPVGLGDHHHHRVRDRAAAQDEQLEHVVEDRRVRAALADDRDDLLEVVAEQLGGELRLARPHPVDVAPERVDLAVVGDHPVRVGQLPAREGVRREPRVDQRQPRRDARVSQVGEVARELGRGQHPLVDHRAAGEARKRQVGDRRRARSRGGSRTACARTRPGSRSCPRPRSAPGGSPAPTAARSRPRGARRPARRATRSPAAPRPRSCPRSAARARRGAPRPAADSRRRRRTGRGAAARRPRLRPSGTRRGSEAGSRRRRPCSGPRPPRPDARGSPARPGLFRRRRGSPHPTASRRARCHSHRARWRGRRGQWPLGERYVGTWRRVGRNTDGCRLERRNVPASVSAPLRLREHGFYGAASGGVHGAKFPVLTGNAGPRSIRDSGGAGP